VQTLEIVLRDWAKGLRKVCCRYIMLVNYDGRSHLVVRLLT
jgi:hypothetical protein